MEATMGLGFRGYIGIMEKKMEATIVNWGYIAIDKPVRKCGALCYFPSLTSTVSVV